MSQQRIYLVWFYLIQCVLIYSCIVFSVDCGSARSTSESDRTYHYHDDRARPPAAWGHDRVINLNVVYCDIIAIKGKLNNICHSKNIKRHRLNGKVILKGLASCYTKKQWFSIILGWQTKVIPLNLSQPTWFIFKIKN